MKSYFSSSPPDDVTATTAIDKVPTDNTEAPVKDNSQEEAADRTAGAGGLSDVLATTDGGGDSSSLIINNIAQQISVTVIED